MTTIRLLSNLETDDDKLLQIVLVGQPELDETLDSIGLRQLKQRIAVRTHLGSLNADETSKYIHQRLQIAGGDLSPAPLFSEQTVAAVYRHSRGLPRLINTICENALITAYARRLPTVPPDVIEDVAKEFRLDVICLPKILSFNELNSQQITTILNDLYAVLRRPTINESNGSTRLDVESSKHEPYI